MPSDINRLFSMIKQAGLPYQVFDDEAPGLPAGDQEAPGAAAEQAANEDAARPHAGLFRAYTAKAPPTPQGQPLADIFRNMSKQDPA